MRAKSVKSCACSPIRTTGPCDIGHDDLHESISSQDEPIPAAIVGGGLLRAPSREPAYRRYERLVRLAPDGLFEWDLASGAAWFSEKCAQLLGLDTPVGSSFSALLDCIHTDDREPLLRALRLHVEQRQLLDVELRTADPSQRWLRLKAEAEVDRSGRPIRSVGIMTDVSRERLARERSRQSESTIRQLLDGLPSPTALLSAGRLLEINRAWRDGAGGEVLTGLRFGYGEDYLALLKSSKDLLATQVAAGIAEVEAGTAPQFSLTFASRGQRASTHQLQVLPLVEAGQRLIVVSIEDVSDLVSASDKTIQLRSFYERLLDSLPLQIAYVRRNGEFAYANAAYERWFGLPSTAIAGRILSDIISPANYAEIAPRVDMVLAGSPVEFECTHAAEGGERRLAVTYLPHHDGEGEVLGFYSVVRDVSAERRLEAGMRQVQKMEAVGQLTGGIAHDFNNLLNVIIGNLQLVERPMAADSRLRRNIETALRSALRGADLTKRLLGFSRQQRLEPHITDPAALIENMRELVVRSIGRAIEIRIRLRGKHPIKVDPGQLEDAVLNLAINARDAMPEGGTLTLATEDVVVGANDPLSLEGIVPGNYVAVMVEDTGTGMSEAVMARAFEPFFTTKQPGKGTGLGLAMVYGFAQQSGGTAVIESRPERGTVIKLLFPRATGQAVPREQAPALMPTRAISGGERILLVENDEDVRATAKAGLCSLGYQVVEASNGNTALSMLAESQVDAMFSDVMLPGGMLGTDLVRRAREHRPGLPIVLATGFADTGVLNRVMAEGNVTVLSKPYSLEELASQLRATLDGDPKYE